MFEPLVTPRDNYSGTLLVIRKISLAPPGRAELVIQCERYDWFDKKFVYSFHIPTKMHIEHNRAANSALQAFVDLNIFNLNDLLDGQVVWRYDIRAYQRKLRRLRKERKLVQN